MTEKRFKYYEHKGADYILDTPNKSLDFIEMLGDCLEAEEIVDLLNQLNDENEQLKQKNNGLKSELQIFKEDVTQSTKTMNELYDEKEEWKSMSVTALNENAILWNEINILMEQGAEPSDAFKKYLESISTEHTKFWQRKLEKAKKDGVIE